jgi:DNA-binding HxlR family transcriptional regulator
MARPTDLVQGTLDLLILKVLSLEPAHGWAIAKRIQQISSDVLQVQQGSLYRRSIVSSSRAGSQPPGARPKPAAVQRSTR